MILRDTKTLQKYLICCDHLIKDELKMIINLMKIFLYHINFHKGIIYSNIYNFNDIYKT